MEAEQMVAVLRRLRHDFGNYLQVILGYIDLNRPEKARNYIQAIVDELMSERNIFESLEPEAALYLYEQLLEARDLGIMLRYKGLLFHSWNILKKQNQPFNTLASLSSQFNSIDDNPVIQLSLSEDQTGVTMLFEWEQPRAGRLEVLVEELK
jgi:stage 0 sporulation protein B (sporulation initiation phosphotransferase)